MDLNLQGKHALVCGASAGIGQAAAIELAALGATVTVLARRAEALDATLKQLAAEHGQQHTALVADLDRPDELPARLADFKPIHILVNNAGGPPGGAVHNATTAEFESGFRRHLLANQTLVQTLLPGMRQAGYGRIINIISTSVKEPIAGLGVSNTIRWAVAGWAKTLARELAPAGITVNNVLPGYTATGRLDSLFAARAAKTGATATQIAEQTRAGVPMGRFAAPGEIAAAIAFLASPAAAYITGINLPVDGGRLNSL